MTRGPTRTRLTDGVFIGNPGDGVARVEAAFELVLNNAAIRHRLDEAGIEQIDEAREKGIISEPEHQQLTKENEAVALAIAVDHFDAAVLSANQIRPSGAS